MSVLCHICGGQMEFVEYCMTCNPDGLDVTEETALKEKVVEASIRWRDVASGKLTVPPWAYVDVERELGDAVDAIQAKRGEG